jgi:hypothetical protein
MSFIVIILGLRPFISPTSCSPPLLHFHMPFFQLCAGIVQNRRLAEEGLHTKMLVSLNSFRPLTSPVGLAHGSFGLVQAVPLSPSRGPDGHFRPVVQIEAMEDVIIGGWTTPVPRLPSPRTTRPDSNGDASVHSNPSPEFPRSIGYPFVRRPSSSTEEIPLSQLSPLERSKTQLQEDCHAATCNSCAALCCGMIPSTSTACGMAWR